MDKEKILAKSRAEKEDEGFDNVKNQGLRIGYKVFCILNIFLIIFNLFRGQNSYALQSLFWGFIATDAYSRYNFSKENKDRLIIISAGIACVVFLINHILYSFG